MARKPGHPERGWTHDREQRGDPDHETTTGRAHRRGSPLATLPAARPPSSSRPPSTGSGRTPGATASATPPKSTVAAPTDGTRQDRRRRNQQPGNQGQVESARGWGPPAADRHLDTGTSARQDLDPVRPLAHDHLAAERPRHPPHRRCREGRHVGHGHRAHQPTLDEDRLPHPQRRGPRRPRHPPHPLPEGTSTHGIRGDLPRPGHQPSPVVGQVEGAAVVAGELSAQHGERELRLERLAGRGDQAAEGGVVGHRLRHRHHLLAVGAELPLEEGLLHDRPRLHRCHHDGGRHPQPRPPLVAPGTGQQGERRRHRGQRERVRHPAGPRAAQRQRQERQPPGGATSAACGVHRVSIGRERLDPARTSHVGRREAPERAARFARNRGSGFGPSLPTRVV